jgi:uncharacterized protein YndB with AHSA1/START domain
MSKNKLELSLPSDTEILLTRTVDAPRDLVFKVYTDPKAIPEFWGPHKYTTRVDKMDVRPGGMWRYIQVDEEGNESAFHGEYSEVKAPEKLVHTFIYEPMPEHVATEHVTFEDHGDKTRIVDLMSFSSKEARDGMVQSGMESGSAELFDRLEELVVSMQKERA